MGLDTVASRTPGNVKLTEEDERAFDEAGLELCGGMLSGEGGSFRGKIYDSVVLEVSGESLYQEWIPPETVGQMASALEACDPKQVVEGDRHVVAEEVPVLASFFRLCAERDLGLIGWS
jgi:hypothetical protein